MYRGYKPFSFSCSILLSNKNLKARLHPSLYMMQNIISRINSAIHKNPLSILFCFWAFVQLFLFLIFGIVTTGEATKYSYEAQNLLNNGHFSEPKYIFYSAYIFLHILFIELKWETTGVYAIQLLVNLLSMYLLFRITFNLSKNILISFLCVFLMIVCYPWQYWTVHLYTESLFCPLIIIFTYVLFFMKKKSRQQIVIAFLLFLLILTTRPTGLYFIPVMGFLFMYKLICAKRNIAALIYVLGICAVFLITLNYAMKSGSSFDFIKPLIENNVICDIPVTGQAPSPPAVLPGIEGNLAGVFEYIIHNPSQFLKMASLKFVSYWGMTRPYYSPSHNLGLICFFYPLYFFAAMGIFWLSKVNKFFTFYAAVLLIIFTLSVMFTCDDWNNRFIMPILPFVILFASFGIKYFYERIINNVFAVMKSALVRLDSYESISNIRGRK